MNILKQKITFGFPVNLPGLDEEFRHTWIDKLMKGDVSLPWMQENNKHGQFDEVFQDLKNKKPFHSDNHFKQYTAFKSCDQEDFGFSYSSYVHRFEYDVATCLKSDSCAKSISDIARDTAMSLGANMLDQLKIKGELERHAKLMYIPQIDLGKQDGGFSHTLRGELRYMYTIQKGDGILAGNMVFL
ncbi:hypothetical protein Cyrtocomes_00844 [Candidatus Cyrtobacter comes]|uniref:Uncharacterized protein n=1 Tax=Candidatus Cyrtobacter comes TaxID=675776 RepID=A0ABU5L9A5_9RICK|nr:hypothetical protein [Candidatus Cyrtobacter comes]MDZ5762460.1 hypothetical protein [Candidatus Cyrtobacter comes]